MWTDFNSKIIKDTCPKQKVSYLTPINFSPTNVALVKHTMEQAQVVGKKCNQTYVQVTYDLVIAKIAYKIQSTSKPQFNTLFIHLGSFHLMMAFFKAIGVFINESGLSHMMIESNIIASGSVNGLVEDKHFNRCKHLYPLMALGLKMLHSDHFLKMNNIEYNFLKKQVIDDLLHYKEVIDSHSSMPIELPNNVLSRVLSAYQKFVEKTRQAARQRWTKSYSIRATIISHVLDVFGLKQLRDVSEDLIPNRIKIYGKQIPDFIDFFENDINPFDESLDKYSLYNIATTKLVPENVATILLNIEKNGEDLGKQFITECVEDQDRFYKSIKKIKCLILLLLQRRKKITLGNKVIVLRMQRDLFGRLLGLPMTNKVEIEKVLGFPLTPIPTSMCHANGSIGKTNKAQLIKAFEKKVSKVNQQFLFFDISILDGFFMLHFMKEVPRTFDAISKKFLKMISVAGIVIKKPTLLVNQNTKQDDDYDDIDNNGSSENDDDYKEASVFCDTFTE
ncbi:uncharacterized protein TNCV_3884421 [Trichonephila clavipes]|nr:uncharacterized protein TNCV_3884421 [Trichonephila clavipes]